MPLEINKPGDALGERPRLSRFGRGVVAAGLIVVVLAGMLVFSLVQGNQRKAALAAAVLDAVERSRLVCTNALGAVGADSEAIAALEGFYRRIEDENQVSGKATAAQEMITYVLSQVHGNQAQVDELNGARNRILVALQQYESQR